MVHHALKKLPLLALLIGIAYSSVGQNFKQFIYLKDKAGSAFSIERPSAFLSARSLSRRAKNGIEVTTQDLPVNASYIQQIAAIQGVKILYPSKWFNAVAIECTDSSALNNVKQLPFVVNNTVIGRGVRPLSDRDLKINTPVILGAEGALDSSIYDTSWAQLKQLNGNFLHEKGFLGNKSMIAIFDAGFNNANVLYCFKKAFDEKRVIATKDFVDNDNDPFSGSGHGTYVWSTIGAYWPGTIVGTAPEAQFVIIRSENESSELIVEEHNWVAAAEFADSIGVDVINSSLIYTTFDQPNTSHTFADMDGKTTVISRAATYLAQRGVVVCNSAGNYGGSSWDKIGAPADADSILAVGAVALNGQKAGFSSNGPTADGRIKPDIMACGAGATVADINGNGITFLSGTSFASPILAGLMACLTQAFPMAKAQDLIQAVKNSGSNAANPNNNVGYGIANFEAAYNLLYKPEIKFGLLSVYPNPVVNGASELKIALVSPKTGLFNLQIFDPLGKVVVQYPLNLTMNQTFSFSINRAELKSIGLYTAKINSLGSNFVTKFIVE